MKSLEEFCRTVGLDDAAVEAVMQNDFDEAECRRLLADWTNISLEPPQFLSFVAHTAYLVAYPEYLKKGIGEDIFIATFRDIRRWQEQYFEDTGKTGIATFRIRWFKNHLRLELFALGALQFQLMAEPDKLNVHIPKGADLSPEAVDDSLRRAFDFFGKEEITFCCESWLLSMELRSLLPAESRIAKFASRFAISSTDYSSHQAEERIFGEVKDDPSSYDRLSSSLQRKAKAFLMEGGRLPSSKGSFHLCKSEIAL